MPRLKNRPRRLQRVLTIPTSRWLAIARKFTKFLYSVTSVNCEATPAPVLASKDEMKTVWCELEVRLPPTVYTCCSNQCQAVKPSVGQTAVGIPKRMAVRALNAAGFSQMPRRNHRVWRHFDECPICFQCETAATEDMRATSHDLASMTGSSSVSSHISSWRRFSAPNRL